MSAPAAVAARLRGAYAARQLIRPPSASEAGFDVAAAYAVQRELTQLRLAQGRRVVGQKVGYANKAMWRVLKLDTLVWGPMFDDTVRYAAHGSATFDTAPLVSPKIEPEIVFKLRAPVPAETRDPAAVLAATDWLAIGFEVIDCVFPDWKYQPSDFVAAYALHAALVVGEPRRVDDAAIPKLAEALPTFTVKLSKDGKAVAEGSGRNSLRSPALCVAELASAMAKQETVPLAAGDLISSGTLTDSMPFGAGETWMAEVSGIDLAPLIVRT